MAMATRCSCGDSSALDQGEKRVFQRFNEAGCSEQIYPTYTEKHPGLSHLMLCAAMQAAKSILSTLLATGQSSSIMKPKHHLEMFEYVKFEETIELVSTTADNIMRFLESNGHQAITQRIDTLYMDVQGAEFKVLLGAPHTLKQIKYIFTELVRGDLYENAVSLANYCALLDTHGFTLNYLKFNKYHHADMLLVRKTELSL